ncbi:MAG: hypothetical protein ACI9B7_000690 [Oleispira sp.]|jgi:hypothetical protein
MGDQCIGLVEQGIDVAIRGGGELKIRQSFTVRIAKLSDSFLLPYISRV